MLPISFKVGKPIDLLSRLKAYIIKNYDANSFDKNIEKFLTEVQQNRNVISNLQEDAKKMNTYKPNKEILLQYLNNLNLLKSKLTFGKEDYAIKICFEWKDTLKDNKWSSYNFNFEYFSNMFNLGKMYYVIGCIDAKEAGDDEAKLKEAIKSLQYAAGLFDTIKNEVTISIEAKEIPTDLSPNYMTFSSYICIALAQINLLKVAEKKKTGLDLQAQLSKGIQTMFENASNLAQDSLKKFVNETTKSYLENRKNYWNAIAFLKMRDKILEQFNQNGKGYGDALAYQGAIVEALKKNEKDLKKLKNMVGSDIINETKELEKQKEMYDKNNRIYFSPIPEIGTLPKIQAKIMANAAMPPELKSDVESRSELDSLIPREVKNMIAEYKLKMMNYIEENLNNYENELKIQTFLNELGLPSSLEVVLSQSEISDSLWRKIQGVQNKGGAMYLSNMLQNLTKKPDEIDKRIADSLVLLQNEEQEDKRLRNQFGSRWTRRVSSDLNGNYILTLNDYRNKLRMAKQYDQQTKSDIQNNLKFFELIALPRDALNNRIPKKVDSNAVKNSNEATALRKDLDDLEAQQTKCMEVINKVFNLLNEDIVAPQFFQVLQKKTTENNILEDNKKRYMLLFNELQVITNEIRNLKISIKAKNEVFLKIKNEQFKPNPQNEEFFKNLDNYVQIFHQKETSLQQGISFYKQCDSKLNELNRNITDFLMARDVEKNQLIASLNSGGNYQARTSNNTNNFDLNFFDFTNQSNQRANTSNTQQQTFANTGGLEESFNLLNINQNYNNYSGQQPQNNQYNQQYGQSQDNLFNLFGQQQPMNYGQSMYTQQQRQYGQSYGQYPYNQNK